MISSSLPDDIRTLSVSTRIELAAAIWESVAEETDSLKLTRAQREELDRRLEARKANPDAGESWEDLRTRLLTKK